MEATELEILCAWSISFILYYYKVPLNLKGIQDTYSFMKPELTRQAVEVGVQLGVIREIPGRMGARYEANHAREGEILQWHDWCDIGLITRDRRTRPYEAMLRAFAQHLKEGKEPSKEADVRALQDELKDLVPLEESPVRVRRTPPEGHLVYFVQVGRIGPIKIGTTMTPESRFSGMQTDNPFELNLLHTAPGDDVEEGILHGYFAKIRLRGEWFRPAPELLAFIASKPKDLYAACTDRHGWALRLSEQTKTWILDEDVGAYLNRCLEKLMAGLPA